MRAQDEAAMGAPLALRSRITGAAGDPARLADQLHPLASAASAGDTRALDLLLWAVDELRLARPAIRRVVINESDVDDVAQDVLIAVAETVSGYRGDARFTTWLSQVARYKAIAHLRRKRDEADLGEVEESDVVRISSQLASRATLLDAMDGLDPAYREPLVLRDVDQLSYEQVAQRLDLNLNTTKSRVARGRAMVAAKLAERRR